MPERWGLFEPNALCCRDSGLRGYFIVRIHPLKASVQPFHRLCQAASHAALEASMRGAMGRANQPARITAAERFTESAHAMTRAARFAPIGWDASGERGGVSAGER